MVYGDGSGGYLLSSLATREELCVAVDVGYYDSPKNAHCTWYAYHDEMAGSGKSPVAAIDDLLEAL